MLPISDATFIVVDVETTGSSPNENRITDIACITIVNYQIVDTFDSLVNPHQLIPRFIQNMTGITNFMVCNAPEPRNVLSDLSRELEDDNTIFVAHNAQFDWTFVSAAMRREHIPVNVNKPPLCTLKLAKKTLPSDIKKNVGAIAEYFDIPIVNRHRAFGDAMATALFFIEMLQIARDRYDVYYVEQLFSLIDGVPPRASRKIDTKLKNKLEKYEKLAPDSRGIIAFIDNRGDVVFIEKANSIVNYLHHLSEELTELPQKMRNILKSFSRLEWIETNNELENNVFELRKIKFYQPHYNLSPSYASATDGYHPLDIQSADNVVVNEAMAAILLKNQSKIILLPNSEREHLVDVYFISEGQYCGSLTVGTRASLNDVFDKIHDVFYDNDEISDFNIDELKTINNWLYKYASVCKIIEDINDSDELIIGEEVERAIRTFYNESIDDDELFIENFIYG
jgi:DNA polymerase III epsilon subunit family exonuclease